MGGSGNSPSAQYIFGESGLAISSTSERLAKPVNGDSDQATDQERLRRIMAESIVHPNRADSHRIPPIGDGQSCAQHQNSGHLAALLETPVARMKLRDAANLIDAQLPVAIAAVYRYLQLTSNNVIEFVIGRPDLSGQLEIGTSVWYTIIKSLAILLRKPLTVGDDAIMAR